MWTARPRLFSTLNNIPNPPGRSNKYLTIASIIGSLAGAGYYYFTNNSKNIKPTLNAIETKLFNDETSLKEIQILRDKIAQENEAKEKEARHNELKAKRLREKELKLEEEKKLKQDFSIVQEPKPNKSRDLLLEMFEALNYLSIIEKKQKLAIRPAIVRAESTKILDEIDKIKQNSLKVAVIPKPVPPKTVKFEEVKQDSVKIVEKSDPLPSVSEVVLETPLNIDSTTKNSILKIEKSVIETKNDIPEVKSPVSEVPLEKSYSASEFSSTIAVLKLELQLEQKRREEELIQKIEGSFASLLSDFTPKLIVTKETPAQVLSNHINFSKYTVEELQKKYEALITAYEDRLENLGVKNYDGFIERLRNQKKKWKNRMEQAQQEHEKILFEKIAERDQQWKNILENEEREAQIFYEEQAKIDENYNVQKTELRLVQEFENELKQITNSLERATNERMGKLEEITKKIREMEEIQQEHYRIIVKMNENHKVHRLIQDLQDSLNNDKGNLSQGLEAVLKHAKNDELVQASLHQFDKFYSEIVKNDVPKLSQIQNSFENSSEKARKTALVTSGTFIDVFLSNLASLFIPKNIKVIDDNNTLEILHLAQTRLEKGDLKGTVNEIGKLNGFAKVAMDQVKHELEMRIAVHDLIEILSAYTLSSVQQTLNTQALK